MKGKFKASAWGVGPVVLCITVLCVFASYLQLQTETSSKKTGAMERELSAREQRIEFLRSENSKAEARVLSLKNDEDAVADFARDELGMVKPGELILKSSKEKRP